MVTINFTIHWWELLIASPFLMLWGFLFYAAMIESWRGMKWFVWVPCIPPILLFGLLDVIFNIAIGSLLYLELPFLHGLTFSQRCCYWFNEKESYRVGMAQWWASILNEISPGHIS